MPEQLAEDAADATDKDQQIIDLQEQVGDLEAQLATCSTEKESLREELEQRLGEGSIGPGDPGGHVRESLRPGQPPTPVANADMTLHRVGGGTRPSQASLQNCYLMSQRPGGDWKAVTTADQPNPLMAGAITITMAVAPPSPLTPINSQTIPTDSQGKYQWWIPQDSDPTTSGDTDLNAGCYYVEFAAPTTNPSSLPGTVSPIVGVIPGIGSLDVTDLDLCFRSLDANGVPIPEWGVPPSQCYFLASAGSD